MRPFLQDIATKFLIRQTPVNGNTTLTGTTDVPVITGQTGKTIYLLSCLATNSSTTATRVTLKNGSDGTAVADFNLTGTGGNAPLAVFPMFVQLTKGNGLFAVLSTAVTDVRLNVYGYII